MCQSVYTFLYMVSTISTNKQRMTILGDRLLNGLTQCSTVVTNMLICLTPVFLYFFARVYIPNRNTEELKILNLDTF